MTTAAKPATRFSSLPRLPAAGQLVRGAVGGVLAGIVFAAMTMWLVASQGMPVKIPLMAIASIVQGEHALGSGSASPVLGAVLHMMLSAVFGALLSLLLHRLRFRTDAGAIAVGAGYGLVLYVVNFVALGNALFAVFTRLNQPFQVLNHLMFGIIVAWTLVVRRSREDGPQARV